MLTMLGTTAPIFLVILLGFMVVRYGIVPKEALPGMSAYVLFLALPLLILQKISQIDLARIVDVDYMLVYGIGLLGSFLLVFLVSRYLLRDSTRLAGLKSLGGAFPNSAFIGFPVLLQYFEQAPAQAFVMCLLVENILLFPLAFALLETTDEQGTNYKKLLVTVSNRLFKSPILIAVAAGIVAALASVPVPDFIDKGMGLLAASAAPVALVVIGGSLAGSKFAVEARDALLISGAKLVFQPLLVLALVIFLFPGMDPQLQQAAIIFTAAPMFSMYPIIGGQYGHQRWCSSILLLTTVLAFFSVTLMLSLLPALSSSP